MNKNRYSIIASAKDKLNDEQHRIFAEHFLLQFIDDKDDFPIYEMKHKFNN